MALTQEEFEQIMQLDKKFKEDEELALDTVWSRDIIALKTNDAFILDYYIGSIQWRKKFSYNKRYRKSIVLLRFDSSNKHTNPDGQVLKGPHVHIYREGFNDKCAFPVNKIGIDKNNINKTGVLKLFLQYCNVVDYPTIQSTLFE